MSTLMTVDDVLDLYQLLTAEEPCLAGEPNLPKLEGALGRVENWLTYGGSEDVFSIAALYAVSIARSHALPDGNKRTAFLVMTTYLALQGFTLTGDVETLAQLMVDVASGNVPHEALVARLAVLCE